MEKSSDQQTSTEYLATTPTQIPYTPAPSSLSTEESLADAQLAKQHKSVLGPRKGKQASTFSRTFLLMVQRVKPVDISGELESIAGGLGDEEEEAARVIITDLDTGRRFPSFDLAPYRARVRISRRLLMGIAAAILVVGLLAGWLLVSPDRSNLTVAQRGPRVLFSATNLGSLYQPGWADDSQYFDGGVLMTCPVPQAPPRSKVQGICGEQHLSFVDDWGNLYSWNQSTGGLAKELALKAGIFQGDSAFSWHWLYPGRYIVSYEQMPGSLDTYRLWDAVQNRLLFATSSAPLFARGNPPFALTSDGWIATLTSRRTIQIWKTHAPLPGEASQADVTTLASPYFTRLLALSWSPDGSELATASSDGTIQIWAPFAHNTLLQTLHVKRAQDAPPLHMLQMVWSPNGKRLASDIVLSTASAPIQIWDLQGGHLLQSYMGQNTGAETLTWLDQGTMMLSGNLGNNVQIWDTTTGRVIADIGQSIEATTFLPAHARLQVSSDRHWLILPQGYDGIQIIDLHTGKLLYTLSTKDNDALLNITLSPDSAQLATVDEYGQIQIWNVQSGRLVTLYQLPANFSKQLKAFLTSAGTWSVPVEMAWSLNSQLLAVTYQGGGLVVLDMNA